MTSGTATTPDVVYFVASSLDGFIADEEGSLEWLISRENAPTDLIEELMASTGVQVMGSTTYEWLLEHELFAAHPEKWEAAFGEMRTVVFSSRDLVIPSGADVTIVQGDVRDHMTLLRASAGDGLIWLVGGGELASQFLSEGLIDRMEITYAPVILGGGTKLFAVGADHTQLQLIDVASHGAFSHLKFDVKRN